MGMKFVRVYKLSKKEEEEKKQFEISLREKAESEEGDARVSEERKFDR